MKWATVHPDVYLFNNNIVTVCTDSLNVRDREYSLPYNE